MGRFGTRGHVYCQNDEVSPVCTHVSQGPDVNSTRVSGSRRQFYTYLPVFTRIYPCLTGLDPHLTGLDPHLTGLDPHIYPYLPVFTRVLPVWTRILSVFYYP